MAVAVPLGLAIGLALGMLGGGGSVLVVPVFVYVLDQSAEQATTTSLVVVTLGALAGGLGQARGGYVCWAHAAAFLIPSLPGIVAGTALGDAVSGSALLAGFALFMLAAAWATWKKAASPARSDGGPGDACPPVRPWRDGTLGLAVGFLTGFFGVGGGFVIVPALAIALGLSMRTAVGTSLAIITATGIAGAAVHFLAGRSVDPGTTAAMTATVAAGALVGAVLGRRVSPATLGRGFALLVAAVAAYVLAASFFLGGPPQD